MRIFSKLSLKKRLLLTLIVNIVFFSPYIIGIIPRNIYLYYFYFFIGGFICYVTISQNISKRLLNLITLVISFCFTLTLSDLILRPLLRNKLYYRPHEMFINRWPPMPLLSRYDKNVLYVGSTFGDLAAMSGVKNYRETRKITFRTDSYGFRNDKIACENIIDIIILGDSFLVGNGTSQEKILSSLLNEKFGFNTYNLSIPGSPWHEFMNIQVEFKRIKTNKGTIVLFALFTGNDLDEYYGKNTNISGFNNTLNRAMVSISSFRNRSLIRQLTERFYHYFFLKFENNIIVKDILNKKILFYKPHVHRKDRTVESIIYNENFNKLKMIFSEMEEFAKSNNLNIAVVLIPTKAEIYPWLLNDNPPWTADKKPSGFSVVIKKLCEDLDFQFLDLKPFLIKEAKHIFDEQIELLYWYDDTHWNDKGHEVVSQIVYNELLRQ